MEEDISSGKFFQGQYFNELLNNDFILEAHSIFVQHCTRTKAQPDFSQQQKSPEETALHFGKQWWGKALPPRQAQGERLPWCRKVEGGVGCVSLHQLSVWHCSLPPVLHQGKAARAPAQLQGIVHATQSLSRVFFHS